MLGPRPARIRERAFAAGAQPMASRHVVVVGAGSAGQSKAATRPAST